MTFEEAIRAVYEGTFVRATPAQLREMLQACMSTQHQAITAASLLRDQLTSLEGHRRHRETQIVAAAGAIFAAVTLLLQIVGPFRGAPSQTTSAPVNGTPHAVSQAPIPSSTSSAVTMLHHITPTPGAATTATLTTPARPEEVRPDYGPVPTDACKQTIQEYYYQVFGSNLAFEFGEPTQASIDNPERPGQKVHGWLFEARWNFKPPARSNFPMAARFLVRSNSIILVASRVGVFETWPPVRY